jgi:hypothetical protein
VNFGSQDAHDPKVEVSVWDLRVYWLQTEQRGMDSPCCPMGQ